MDLQVSPTDHLSGTVLLPASKSYSIRAFLIAACGGESRIIRPSDCDDAKTARLVARQLGARIRRFKEGVWSVKVSGNAEPRPHFSVQESGTVLRLLLPLLALREGPAWVEGEGTLIGRPNHHLAALLRRQGVDIRGTGKKESVPIALRGGRLRSGEMTIDGSLSSQFVSALLLACPLLSGDSVIRLTGDTLVSQDYVEMTLQMLEMAGITIERLSPRELRVPGGQTFQGLKNFQVPADSGLAAFHLAAAALVGSDIHLTGHLRNDLIQADSRIFECVRQLGVRVTRGPASLKVKGPFPLAGGEFSLKDAPDLVPVMAVLGLFGKKPLRLTGIAHARAKESDRIGDLAAELRKLKADIETGADYVLVRPREIGMYQANATLDPRQDHRLAMAFAVAGLKLGVKVKNIECVSKSYPGFVSDFRALGARARRQRIP